MTNLQSAGLVGIVGIGIAVIAYVCSQRQDRKREQECFRREREDFKARTESGRQMITDLSSRLVKKDEQVRVLLQENRSLKERDTETRWQTFA